MSQKHKRRPDEGKHSSRMNVFERLGDSNKERVQVNYDTNGYICIRFMICNAHYINDK